MWAASTAHAQRYGFDLRIRERDCLNSHHVNAVL